MSAERWLPVVGFEKYYEVSDYGRVRSWHVNPSRGPVPRLVGVRGGDGYIHLTLSGDGRVRMTRVHRVVLEAFVGPRPEGAVTRHLNGDPADNRLENLAYGTQSENNYDAVRQGKNQSANKTECPQGHPYSPENTRVVRTTTRTPFRQCRTCEAARNKLRTERRRVAGRSAA